MATQIRNARQYLSPFKHKYGKSCPRLLQGRDFLHAPRTPLLRLLPPWLLPKFSSSSSSPPCSAMAAA
ncbi:hypothetical protein ACFX1R_027044 [Malus domestica]